MMNGSKTTKFALSGDLCGKVGLCGWVSQLRLAGNESRTLPETIEACRELRITISDQVACLDSNIIQPHGGISRLLKHPFFIGMKRGRTHKNAKASKEDKAWQFQFS